MQSKTNSASEERSVCTSRRFLRASEYKEQDKARKRCSTQSSSYTCLHVKAISEAVDEAAPLNREEHENLRAGWNSRVLASAFVRPEAGLAGSGPALARRGWWVRPQLPSGRRLGSRARFQRGRRSLILACRLRRGRRPG